MIGHGKLGTWYSNLNLDAWCSDSASILDSNSVTAKDDISCTYCCYVRNATLIVWDGWILPKQAVSLPGKVITSLIGRAIKVLVFCYVVWLVIMIYGMGLWTSVRYVGLVPFTPHRCILKDRQTVLYRVVSLLIKYLEGRSLGILVDTCIIKIICTDRKVYFHRYFSPYILIINFKELIYKNVQNKHIKK